MKAKKSISSSKVLNLLGIAPKNFLKDNEFTNITFDLTKATLNDIVFYNLNTGLNNFETLRERLRFSKFGILFVSIQEDTYNEELLNIENVFLVEPKKFLNFQKILLDELFPLELKSHQKLIGITGTNGKTSTAFFSHQLFLQNKKSSFCLGTLGVFDKNNDLLPLDSGLTTPPYIELRKIFYKYFVEKKYDFGIMEVSSHSLELDRVFEIKFDVCAWTNFKQDHLDFHKTMDEYFKSKMLLPLKHLKNKKNFFISDGDIDLQNRLSKENILFRVVSEEELSDSVLGSTFLKLSFNRKNISLAKEIVKTVLDNPTFNLNIITAVPGRMDFIEIDGKQIFIDFAHTPDALENVMSEIKGNFNTNKIFLVFGCGGNRDSKKRPLMASVAEQYADKIIVTNDNPREEDPNIIFKDILSGFNHPNEVKVIEDRKIAISSAINEMKKGEVLVVAGKGAENYQIIGKEKIPYNDLSYIKSLITKGISND